MTKLTSIFLIAFFQLLSCLPIRLLRAVGSWVGSLLWLSKSRSRAVTEENLAICFPEMNLQQREQLGQDSLKHLAMTGLELGPIWRRPVAKLLSSIVAVEGEQYIQQAMAAGKGVIILAPHIGAWELLGLYIAEHFPLTCLYQPPDNPAMHDLIVNSRTRSSIKLAPTNTKGVKVLLQTLKKGEAIAILPDQVPPSEGGDFAPFFGTPALSTTLVKNLAKRTGAAVITASALRVTNSGQFKIVYQPVADEVAADDALRALTALNQSVEACVSNAPEQYQWEYKRFKRQPDGERKFYQF